MKKPSDHIFQLVQAMTPAEKRYFRRHFASEDNRLTYLFDELNKMAQYDESALKARLDPMTAKNIKVYKIQLQEILLRSLTAFHSKRSVQSKVRLMLEEADILADKQLHEQALDRLAKAKVLCQQYEEFTYLIEIATKEFHLRHVSIDKNGISKHPFFEEVRAYLNQIIISQTYLERNNDFLDKTVYRTHDSPSQELKQLASELIEREKGVNPDALPFKARFRRNTLLMGAYEATGDLVMSGKMRQANVELFKQFPHFQRSMPFQFIGTLRNLMNYAIELEDLETAQTCVDTGIAYIHACPACSSQLVYFHYGALEIHLMSNHWSKISGDWEHTVLHNLRHHGIEKERIAMLCYFCFAVACQILGKLSKVQYYLRRVNQCREEVKASAYEFTMLLDLINHFEAGDTFLVDKQLKNIRHKQAKDKLLLSELMEQFWDILAEKSPQAQRHKASTLLSKRSQWDCSTLKWFVNRFKVFYWLEAVALGQPWVDYMKDKNADTNTTLTSSKTEALGIK